MQTSAAPSVPGGVVRTAREGLARVPVSGLQGSGTPITPAPLPVDIPDVRDEEAGAASPGIARPPAQAPLWARGGVPLRASALGPGMDLVVGEEPDPGVDAVLSYARDSGFGAEALKKLFGAEATARAGVQLPAPMVRSAPAQPTAPAAQVTPDAHRAADPAVLSMAAWIGGRAGVLVTAARSPSPASSALPGAGLAPDRVGVAGASTTRPAGFEPPSPVGLPTVATASSTAVVPPAGATPAADTGTPGGAPPSHAALAHRLAEATATRMVAELRQGNARLRLQIEPASLGKVDVDMTMRQGALEATIVAHQAATRELLADGLPRLRDTLAQLGMNVAAVEIKSGLGGQNDGKPTNQHNREIWYSARRAPAGSSTSPVDGGDQRRSSRLDLWA